MKTTNTAVVGTMLAIVLILVLVIVFANRNDSRDTAAITSFEECEAAGYPIMESYPEQCRTPEGQLFVREIDENELPPETLQHIQSKQNMIVVQLPEALAEITSPLTVRGVARGTWFFEADFPISLIDSNGATIATSFASAVLDPEDPDSTWMTEEFVPFEGTITFTIPAGIRDSGTLIFHKDNPSGLPENDDFLSIPVRF